MGYLKNIINRNTTPQSLPIPASGQVPNSAGGYAWQVDDWMRLERFLILGSEGGSYYASETKLSAENADGTLKCIAGDGPRAVAMIEEISVSGRAPKNDPAIFALALAASHGDLATRRAALRALPQVCRIGTHLFHFAQYVDGMRGWGRGLRQAVSDWYGAMPAEQLAYQTLKYQQRDGWSHRDLLRLSHPKPADETRKALYYWITQGWPDTGATPHPDDALRLIWAAERLKQASTAAEVVSLIGEYRIPREAVPTVWLTEPSVWEALLADMPMTALIRNLATLTKVGVIAPGYAGLDKIVGRITDRTQLRKARVHPIAVLAALRTYAQGHGQRGSGTWAPVPAVIDALNDAFYAAFETIQPTGKRWLLALDVSGSMSGGVIAGVPGLTPRDASAAMAMVTACTEKHYQTVGFTAGSGGYGGRWGGGEAGLTPLAISPKQRLDDVIKTVSGLPFGGTDCALPMVWATKNRVETDVFVIYTDNETWFGDIHPAQALREYRQRMGIPAKLVVVGMTANGFSIADPDDAGMLDVVGFDTAAPQLIADFAR